jgi:hypothetical protein
MVRSVNVVSLSRRFLPGYGKVERVILYHAVQTLRGMSTCSLNSSLGPNTFRAASVHSYPLVSKSQMSASATK